MKIFLCATHAEAKPFIDFYRLKKGKSIGVFDVFRDEKCYLMISGLGGVRMSAAVGAILSYFPDSIVINIGIAGAPQHYRIGSLYWIHKITTSTKTLYPEMIDNLPLEESELYSVDSPLLSPLHLCDMEGGYFFEAATFFVPLENIFVFKVVSDHGNFSTLTKEKISSLLASHVTLIDNALNIIAHNRPSTITLTDEQREEFETFVRNARFTASQTQTLHTIIKRRARQQRAWVHLSVKTEVKSKGQSKALFESIQAQLQ